MLRHASNTSVLKHVINIHTTCLFMLVAHTQARNVLKHAKNRTVYKAVSNIPTRLSQTNIKVGPNTNFATWL